MGQQQAKLRVCASCEWIFSIEKHGMCPKCGFAHYGARYVYGDKCYKYKITQEPWINRKVQAYTLKLFDEVNKDL
jgi:hypothetical protein